MDIDERLKKLNEEIARASADKSGSGPELPAEREKGSRSPVRYVTGAATVIGSIFLILLFLKLFRVVLGLAGVALVVGVIWFLIRAFKGD